MERALAQNGSSAAKEACIIDFCIRDMDVVVETSNNDRGWSTLLQQMRTVDLRHPTGVLDAYWNRQSGQLRFLKIAAENCAYDILRGADGLLRRHQVDIVQFTYVPGADGVRWLTVWSLLRRNGYRVLDVETGSAVGIGDQQDHQSDFLAIHERLAGPLLNEPPETGIAFPLLDRYGIRPTGALHVGAHKGDEIKTYRARGISPVVFIEANPGLAQGLRDRFAKDADVTVIECAASDSEGTATFKITSMDQSSSLLDLKDHAKLYPKIGVTETIEVRTAPLDQLLAEAGVDLSKLDFIAMDIQGAELMALRGATETLKHINALQLEVNYSELYEGCPLISDLDAFLGDHGFIRVMTNTPYSEEWGDALYIRRPMVTCSAVGNMGRFGNQLYQYMFIQSYAREHDFTAATPVWAGDEMFEVKPGVDPLPKMPFGIEETKYDLETSNIANDPLLHPNTDFTGFFQYHSRYYKPYKAEILRDFTFKGAYADRVAEIAALFEKQPGPVVPLHLRRGDFGTGVFFIAPESWYLDWLAPLRQAHSDLTLYIASDDPAAVLPAFKDFNVLTEADLPATDLPHGFFTDFAALTLGDHLAISNSSFSFAASLLNKTAQSFARPCLTEQRLIPYEPWNAPVLLRAHEAEDVGEEFMSDRAKGRSKYKWRKLRKLFG